MTNEDAIKWLENLKNDIGNPHYECLWPYAQAIDEIAELLKEQHERIERLHPKKGKWLEYAGDQKCSVCGSSYSDLFPEYDRTPFCPHCGAKMESGGRNG